MSRRPTWILGAVAVLLVMTGCGSTLTPPAAKEFPVDTPELVQLKAAARVEPCPEAQVATKPGGGLPAVTLPCLGGGTAVDLATLKGPLVINVWSSACEPCRREMPALGEFHRRYGDQVPLLGIDLQDTYPGVALKQAAERNATYPQIFDFDGEIQKTKLNVPGLPTFWFLAEDGTLTAKSGGLESLEEVVTLVNDQFGLELS